MFLNREGDLARLERWWQSEQPELITVYGRRQVGIDVLRTLERRVASLPKVHPQRQLALFSRSGFTDDVLAARTPDLALFDLEDLFGE